LKSLTLRKSDVTSRKMDTRYGQTSIKI